ncbi:RDD family protein [Methylotenera mobilis]|uniref:RDD domain containing protein n=1 Tax=Methylotenera mobilis (strain JLW8 / ATCC BAA-1282 / DSM 17540) TaxID=583345 RepID=C6WWA4_METML|nr:RDD family protein [Methylotenera mobilis]ACT48203.1 RDD domain containing protein [Methylotenera mobilis JLW8]
MQDTTIKLAHPGKRFLGQFIDGLITYSLSIFTFYLLHTTIGKDAALFLAVIIGLTYFLFSDALPNGQSIGKKLLKIKVIDHLTMQPCSCVQSFLRNITFPLGIFDWVFIFFGSHRRLGDFMASTLVVKI